MLASNILDIVTLAIILLIAISLHEYSHAYVSYRLWDPTPKLQWRLTTNPLKHIDPIWFLMIFLIWFWWWKPVQINPSYYKNPLKWELLVALAGPAMNLVLAIAGIFVMLVSAKLTWLEFWSIKTIVESIMYNRIMMWPNFMVRILAEFSLLNIILAVFNMIPIPPLDGFSIVKMLFPKFTTMIQPYTRYVTIWFLLLLFFWSPFSNFLRHARNTIFILLFTFFANIFY